MSTAPTVHIDPAAFRADPYPALAAMRRDTPICFVPELGSTLLTRRDDIFVCEKDIAAFSSEQPGGLMTRLMGHNMMRKDGGAHMAERRQIFASVSPRTVKGHWTARFRAHAERLIRDLVPRGRACLVKDLALPLSGECLKEITGLINITAHEMDAWSQAMIDGIANYAGDSTIEARCHAATASIDRAIDGRLPDVRRAPDPSLLSVMLEAGMPLDSVRANVKLAISGGQNEPRDAIAGAVWALLAHSGELALVRAGRATWMQAFEEYARWMAPIGMSPRRIARRHEHGGVAFEPEDRVFLMFGSANRDEACFEAADQYRVTRDTSKSIAFGAGPHYCAGAFASRAIVADVALPAIFGALPGLAIDTSLAPPRLDGWAFRGLLNLPVVWAA